MNLLKFSRAKPLATARRNEFSNSHHCYCNRSPVTDHKDFFFAPKEIALRKQAKKKSSFWPNLLPWGMCDSTVWPQVCRGVTLSAHLNDVIPSISRRKRRAQERAPGDNASKPPWSRYHSLTDFSVLEPIFSARLVLQELGVSQ